MSKALNLANLGRNSAKLLFEKNVSQKYGSFLPLNVTPVSQRKAYSAYYGEPAEYKESQGNVLLVNEQNVILNFGPQHPAAHGVLRLILELDGEVITNFQSEYITSSI